MILRSILVVCRVSWMALGIAMSLIMWVGAAKADTWFADPNAAPGGDGSSSSPYVTLGEAVGAAGFGDTLRLAGGRFVESNAVTIGGTLRRAVLPLVPGLVVLGAENGQTRLAAPSDDPATFGITLQFGGNETVVRDLTIDGPCWIGVFLWGSAARLENVDVEIPLVGSSSTAFDAREGSFPTVVGCRFDGGHSGMFIEFRSGGLYRDCWVTPRPRQGLVIIDSTPVLQNCTIEGSGVDTVVLTQGSQPTAVDCFFGEGARWTVRVFDYSLNSQVDLSGNRWFSQDVESIRAGILDAEVDSSLGATVVFEPLSDPLAQPARSVGQLKRRYAIPGAGR